VQRYCDELQGQERVEEELVEEELVEEELVEEELVEEELAEGKQEEGKVSGNPCTEILAFYIYLDWRRFLIESWKTNPLDTRWLGSILFTC